jgi:rod shape-determining protein MreD
MPAHNQFAVLYVISTIAVAMVLRVMFLFPGVDEFNPDWIILVLMYWSIAIPERFGVFTAFSVGLLTDVLTGHLLGQYALIYALICYLSIKEYRRLRQFPLPQQCLFVGLCLFCGQSLLFGMESMQGANHLPLSFWYSVFSGMLAWPVVFLILRAIRMLARIS